MGLEVAGNGGENCPGGASIRVLRTLSKYFGELSVSFLLLSRESSGEPPLLRFAAAFFFPILISLKILDAFLPATYKCRKPFVRTILPYEGALSVLLLPYLIADIVPFALVSLCRVCLGKKPSWRVLSPPGLNNGRNDLGLFFSV